jgi:hypothetical protein
MRGHMEKRAMIERPWRRDGIVAFYSHRAKNFLVSRDASPNVS